MHQPLVGQLVNADLRIRARVADLETHDLPRRRMGRQRRGGVHMQAPLPHAEQVDAPHVGQTRAQAGQTPQQRTQVLLSPLEDNVHREIASRRRRGRLRCTRLTARQVRQHRRERLQDARVRAHRRVNAGQDQGNEGTARVDAPRRLVRRIHQANLSLTRKVGEHVLHIGQRGPQLRKLAHGAAQHLRQGIRPPNVGRRRNQRRGEHAAQGYRCHLAVLPQGPSPGFEEASQRDPAVPNTPADKRLHASLKSHTQVGARLQGVHRGSERSHRCRRIRPRIAVRPIPAIKVVKKGREPRCLLGTGTTGLDDNRCVELHDSPFLPVLFSPRRLLCAT